MKLFMLVVHVTGLQTRVGMGIWVRRVHERGTWCQQRWAKPTNDATPPQQEEDGTRDG